jgi:RHS Repeat
MSVAASAQTHRPFRLSAFVLRPPLQPSAALVAISVALKPAQTTYGYNSRGDRKSITSPTGTVTNLAYDQLDRMTGYGANATYTYNGDGLRMSKTVSGSSEAFTWDSNTSDGIPRPLVDGTTSYVYDPQGHPLEQSRRAAR